MRLFLELAGFTFEIHYQTKHKEFLKTLLTEIRKHYGKLIVSPSKKVDCVIELEYVNLISLEEMHDKFHYILLYREIAFNHYETFSYITITQFSFLISRIIKNILISHNGFIIHASGNLIDGKAVLFLGKSGAGKSTISNLLSSKFPSLADDNIIIRKLRAQYFVFQSPMLQNEKSRFKSSEPIPLDKIFFISKSLACSSRPIKNKSILFKKMLEHMWAEKDNIATTATQVQIFTSEFRSFHRLGFPKDKKQVQNFFKSLQAS